LLASGLAHAQLPVKVSNVKADEILKLRTSLSLGLGIACFTLISLAVGLDILGADAGSASRPATTMSAAEREFVQTAAPMFKQFCSDCHGETKAKAQLNLARLSSEPNLGSLFKTWEKVIAMLEQKEMPPEDEPQPSNAERNNSSPVSARRLTNLSATRQEIPAGSPCGN
jgi:hypothetical protein